MKKCLLLHVCCGPCSTHCIEQLTLIFNVSLFFCNSNIASYEEYLRRVRDARKVGNIYGLRFIESIYDPHSWNSAVKDLEDEPEGKKRCETCFELSFSKTADHAATYGYDLFSTTLSVSPYKNSSRLFEIGKKVASIYNTSFLKKDFSENDGYKHSIKLSKKYSLYRQKFCGCIYSMTNI